MGRTVAEASPVAAGPMSHTKAIVSTSSEADIIEPDKTLMIFGPHRSTAPDCGYKTNNLTFAGVRQGSRFLLHMQCSHIFRKARVHTEVSQSQVMIPGLRSRRFLGGVGTREHLESDFLSDSGSPIELFFTSHS